ncbi:MAG: hypothetical protein O2781_02525 [Bacteroidetes bacterium]|nr:hypothetical protein [Bacteroidota bacterium]
MEDQSNEREMLQEIQKQTKLLSSISASEGFKLNKMQIHNEHLARISRNVALFAWILSIVLIISALVELKSRDEEKKYLEKYEDTMRKLETIKFN